MWETWVQSLGWGNPSGEGNGYPVQYSCLVEKEMQPIPVFLPRESQGQRSLVGCCPRGHTESDTTEATQHACMHALEKEMAIHSTVLAWRIPGTEESSGLPSMGSHRVRHNWSDLAAAAMMDTCHCKFVKAIEWSPPREGLDGNYGLCVIVMSPC